MPYDCAVLIQSEKRALKMGVSNNVTSLNGS